MVDLFRRTSRRIITPVTLPWLQLRGTYDGCRTTPTGEHDCFAPRCAEVCSGGRYGGEPRCRRFRPAGDPTRGRSLPGFAAALRHEEIHQPVGLSVPGPHDAEGMPAARQGCRL